MDEYPNLSCVIVTYKRTELALRTIQGLGNYLAYPKDKVYIYVADDGSPREHVDAILKEVSENGFNVLGYHNQKFVPGTTFSGKGWNQGLGMAHQKSPFVLWLEDDWELRRPLALSPYLRMLHDQENVGMVRLGHLAIGSEVDIVSYSGIHYLNYKRTTPYAYSGNPHIRHVRFSDACGLFKEDCTPGEIELDYDQRFRHNPSIPQIWRPADIAGWGIFGHIGTEKTW
jgi:GT2 family glycosyltransferase